MIEELRIYRIRAGGLNDYLRHAKEIQVLIRGIVTASFWDSGTGKSAYPIRFSISGGTKDWITAKS